MKKILVGIVVILLIIIDVSSLLYPTVSNYVNSLSHSRVVAWYTDDLANQKAEHLQALLEAAREYNEALLRKNNRFSFTEDDAMEYDSLLNTGLGVIGILVIDKINVKLPIYHGVEEKTLQIGLGHLPGTSLPVGGESTHALITGHRGLPSSKLLTDLGQIVKGDRFELHIMGETLTYQAVEIQVVEPNETSSLDIRKGFDYCTLVTCTPYGINSHRLLVHGRRVENTANPDWEMVRSDAVCLDKALVIFMFLVPLLPLWIIYVMIRCRKIHKGGNVRR